MSHSFYLRFAFKRTLKVLFILLMSLQTFGQSHNLVPNPSFSEFKEAMKSIPKYADEHFTKNVQHWYAAVDPSLPPHFITPQLKSDLGQKHLLTLGDTVFAGMVLGIGGGVGGANIGVELTEALSANKKYLVKMRLAVPAYSKKRRYPEVLPNNFGILFSKEKIVATQQEKALIPYKPQVDYGGTALQPFRWIELAQVFQPQQDGLKFLTLGTFCPERVSVSFNNFYYYFIDSVYVAETQLAITPSKAIPIAKAFKPVSLYFDTGNARLAQQHEATLDTLIEHLKMESPVARIELIGYADVVGDEVSNLELSQKRALAAFEYLVQNGLDSNRIALRWEGEVHASELAKNRRVDIRLSDAPIIALEAEKPLPTDWQSVYRFSSDIEEADNKSFKDISFSRIAEYERAASESNRLREPEQRSPEDIEALRKGQPRNAFSYILEKAAQEKMLLINEAHNRPKHRAFVARLLDSLYQQGYRYLGLEMLFDADTAINSRGYAVLSSGFYSQEPVAGDLIRLALKTGYYVFGYDADHEETEAVRAAWVAKEKAFAELSDAEQNMNARDRVQADKIAQKMEADPDGKYLILAGFGHIRENITGFWQPMAYQLKKHYQIDPFTIDQVAGDLDNSNSSFHMLFNVGTPRDATIIQTNRNQAFAFKEYDFFSDTFKACYDAQVIQPVTENGHHE